VFPVAGGSDAGGREGGLAASVGRALGGLPRVEGQFLRPAESCAREYFALSGSAVPEQGILPRRGFANPLWEAGTGFAEIQNRT